MKRKQGISLIVLIITIVVIIILAAAIIMNLQDTDVISNAKEAVVKQDFRTLQDELDMHIADQYIEKNGDFNPEDLNATTKTKVADILKSITKTNYADYVLIENGSIVISDSMPDPQKTWAMEVLGLISASNNKPTGSQGTPVVTIGTKVTTANSSITGEKFAYNNPVIPVGFKAVNTTDASWNDENNDGCPDGWNNGLVIRDDYTNEYVWVPCTLNGANGTITYTKRFNEYPKLDMESVSDDEEALPMKDATTRMTETEQITKYGGFYVARYEAGVSNLLIPVSISGRSVWVNETYSNARTLAKKEFEMHPNLRSGLVTGTAWDTICAWISSETDSQGNPVHDVVNSVSWGNHVAAPTDGAQFVTGSLDLWKAKNIYDFAGNTDEWTGEKGADGRSVYRDAANRYNTRGTMGKTDVGFRVMLYVM